MQPLLYFHYFFNIKFVIFFSKTYLTKSVRNVEIAFLYIMKHVKILLGKVTTLHFMYDVYIYIYIYKGEAHIQLHVQLICTVSTKHTDVLIWSSWGVKDHATSSLFSLFFQHKICNFFFKNVLGWDGGGREPTSMPRKGGGLRPPPLRFSMRRERSKSLKIN